MMKRSLSCLLGLLLLCGCAGENPADTYQNALDKLNDMPNYTAAIRYEASMKAVMMAVDYAVAMTVQVDNTADDLKTAIMAEYNTLRRQEKTALYTYQMQMFQQQGQQLTVRRWESDAWQTAVTAMDILQLVQGHLEKPKVVKKDADKAIIFEVSDEGIRQLVALGNDNITASGEISAYTATCTVLISSQGELKSLVLNADISAEIYQMEFVIVIALEAEFTEIGNTVVTFPEYVTSGEYNSQNTPATLE